MNNRITAIDRILDPAHIAIIGASETPEKVGRIVMEHLERSSAVLYPINPKAETIPGRKALKSVEELPRDIDLAIITINSEAAMFSAKEKGKSSYQLFDNQFHVN